MYASTTGQPDRQLRYEMGISKIEPLTTFRPTESISIAYFYAKRGQNKEVIFSMTLQLDPHLV